MIKPEPIELENNLGPDAVTGEINRVPWKAYDVDEMDIYIAELESRVPVWHKFPDEKPKWGEEVLVVDDANKRYIVRFSHDMKWISWGKMNTCESNCVKYWMPLPSAPKDDEVTNNSTAQ
jgi:hypothetical protein